ncbi:MAG TPA: hypothetical protein DDY72_03585 [Verrucomicrobia bacterium]|nr:hypothetical protein [Verrucomicrobiota bacterium]
MFEVRKLSFAYKQQPLLRDVSFVVSPGEVISLVGRNGAGKSTLLRILSTVIMPQAGQVLVEGRDVVADPMSYRTQIGYLPETPSFYEEMSVKAYLKFRARLKGEPEKRIRRHLAESVETCHITDILEAPIRVLSFGQKKRVALADALLLRPRILLLDDVCAGLDASMRATLDSLLSTIASFSCVIVSGHEIADMLRWSTRVLVLDEGAITLSQSVAGVDRARLEARLFSALKGEVE